MKIKNRLFGRKSPFLVQKYFFSPQKNTLPKISTICTQRTKPALNQINFNTTVCPASIEKICRFEGCFFVGVKIKNSLFGRKSAFLVQKYFFSPQKNTLPKISTIYTQRTKPALNQINFNTTVCPASIEKICCFEGCFFVGVKIKNSLFGRKSTFLVQKYFFSPKKTPCQK